MGKIAKKETLGLAKVSEVRDFLNVQADKIYEPGFQLIQISHQTATFASPGFGAGEYITGIILAVEKTRALWPFGDDEIKKVLTEWSGGRPICFSRGEKAEIGRGELTEVLADDSPDPVKMVAAPILEADCVCSRCKWAEFGSLGKGQACKAGRRFLIWQPDSRIPGVLAISPTSIRNWQQYRAGLEDGHFGTVLTRFSLNLQSRGQLRWSTVVFEVAGEITDKMIAPLGKFVTYKGQEVIEVRALVNEFLALELDREIDYPDNGTNTVKEDEF